MAHLTWAIGGGADLLSLEEDRIKVLSTSASAPGSRPIGRLASGSEVRMKVHRCRRVEGGFELEGRLIDVTREVRGALAKLLSPDG